MPEQEVVEWWRVKHELADKRYLTGSSLTQVCERLYIDVPKDLNVLEIGVGLGICTKALYENYNNVYALDVSCNAILPLVYYLDGAYINPTCLPNDKFDLAISHLVAQHMNDSDLREQISWVLNSLKTGGLFAIQYAECEYRSQSVEAQQKGSVCRSPKEMSKLCKEAGAEHIIKHGPSMYGDIAHYVVHIR